MQKNKQEFTPVRFSHLTTNSGVGSIVRNAHDILIAVTDTRYWTDKNNRITGPVIPFVRRICNAFGMEDKELRMPPTAQVNSKGMIIGDYLPAVVFPTYASCQKCNLLHPNPWRNQDKKTSEKVYCETCLGHLEQVIWCAVSTNGFLDDVPWHSMCHQDENSVCKANYTVPYMTLTTAANGKTVITCTHCRKWASISNYVGKINLNKQQPWLSEISPVLGKDDLVMVLEVNTPGVYTPQRSNAIVIPPESRMRNNDLIDKLSNNSKLLREIDEIKIELRRKVKLQIAATEYRCSVDEVTAAIKEIKDGYPYYDMEIPKGDLMQDEYDALLLPLKDLYDNEDFITTHQTEAWKDLLKKPLMVDSKIIITIVTNLVTVNRLREIEIFKGFSRGPSDLDKLVPPHIDGESSWLPAVELWGEGLFFSIDENILKKWECLEEIKKRAIEIQKRNITADVNTDDITISPRFIFLHTLAHLIIKELEVTSGYPATSLKERVYCSIQNKKDKVSSTMSGILIYTAVPDMVGSLGGIVENSEPVNFLNLLSNAFKHAQWCSLDPVCTEHQGQGPGWLNRAACHACALIPERSCQYKNVFLDRVFIKGNETDNVPNFLDFVNNLGDNNG
jgi:hypothetical protein